MKIEELYENSANLVQSVPTAHVRYLMDQIEWNARIVGLMGARGVGKTTLLLQHLREVQHAGAVALYVSLDDLWFTQHRLVDLARFHYTRGGTHLFIDEVHRYPYQNWIQEIKNIYDRYPGFRVVFTGSSLLHIDNSIADLSRRCLYYHLQGLSFREYLSFAAGVQLPTCTLVDIWTRHQALASEICSKVKVLKYFSDYLRMGYYPFYQEVRRGYGLALRQMAVNVLEQDVPTAQQVEFVTINRMKRLLVLISQMSPFTVNLTNLAQELGCDRSMALKLLSILQRADLIRLLYKGRSNVSQLVKPEKVYLDNSNLMYALTGEPDTGNIRETFFANQVGQAHELAYTGKGDFLIDGQYVVEVGGHRKSFGQIKDVPNSFLAVDDVEMGVGNRIPLWLFGFLY